MQFKGKDVTMTYTGPLSWWNGNLEMLVFVMEENQKTRRKTFGAMREPTTNLRTMPTIVTVHTFCVSLLLK